MKLLTELIAAKNNFVSLPYGSFSSARAQLQPYSPLILRLEWDDYTNTSSSSTTPAAAASGSTRRRAFVSWMGAISQPKRSSSTYSFGGSSGSSGGGSGGVQTIGIPTLLAGCLGITQSIMIDVDSIGSVTPTRMVCVSPASADDWEMLELNQSSVETGLLDQVNVVTDGTSFPFWLRHRQLIRLRVTSSSPMGFAYLARNSEIAVAPISRPKPTAAATATTPSSDESSNDDTMSTVATPRLRLRVQPYPPHYPTRYGISGHIWVNMTTLLQLKCAEHSLVVLTNAHRTHRSSAALTPDTHADGDDPNVAGGVADASSSTDTSSKYTPATSTVVRIASWNQCSDGHVLIPDELRHHLDIDVFHYIHVQPVYATIATCITRPIHSIILRPITWTKNNTTSARVPNISNDIESAESSLSESQSRDALLAWSRTFAQPVPLINGSIISTSLASTSSSGNSKDNNNSMKNDYVVMINDDSCLNDNKDSKTSSSSSQLIDRKTSAIVPPFAPPPHLSSRSVRLTTAVSYYLLTESQFITIPPSSIASSSSRSSSTPAAGALPTSLRVRMGPAVTITRRFDYPSNHLSFPPINISTKPASSPGEQSSMGSLSSETLIDRAELRWLGGMDSIITSTKHYLSSILCSDLIRVRNATSTCLPPVSAATASTSTTTSSSTTALSTPQPVISSASGLIICGASGSGRSTLAMSLCRYYRHQLNSLAMPFWISCGDLVTAQIPTIRRRIRNVLSEAVRCQPSIIVFDDLDKLAPAVDSSGGNGAIDTIRIRQICEYLVDSISDCRSSLSTHQSIAMIAIVKSVTSLHQSLQMTGLFANRIEITAPDDDARTQILTKALAQQRIQLTEDIGPIAQLCEGYSGQDLHQLVSRAIHQATIRCLDRYHDNRAATLHRLSTQPSTDASSTTFTKITSISDGWNDHLRRQYNLPYSATQPRQPFGQLYEVDERLDSFSVHDHTSSSPSSSFTSSTSKPSYDNDEVWSSDDEDEIDEPSTTTPKEGVSATPTADVNTTAVASVDSSDRIKIEVTRADFTEAMKGFVPASLKDLPLTSSTTSWSDIGGLDEVRSVLKETLELPARFARLFERVPLKLRSGLLLYGAPGCGKTLLASAVAKECGLNFISIKGPELLNKYIGASEESVRDTFARAAAAAPCVLFFDEFEAIVPRRGGDSTGVTDRVVNQFLCQLDGVEGRAGVYVLAASSRPDLIDPALLRPGRLDKSLYCSVPTRDERLSILQAIARKMSLAPDVELKLVAERTETYTGADLRAILTNAQLLAINESIESSRQLILEAKSRGLPPPSSSSKLPVITNTHIMTSLSSSASSLSSTDRQRFAQIYDKFVTGKQAKSTDFDPKGKLRTTLA